MGDGAARAPHWDYRGSKSLFAQVIGSSVEQRGKPARGLAMSPPGMSRRHQKGRGEAFPWRREEKRVGGSSRGFLAASNTTPSTAIQALACYRYEPTTHPLYGPLSYYEARSRVRHRTTIGRASWDSAVREAGASCLGRDGCGWAVCRRFLRPGTKYM